MNKTEARDISSSLIRESDEVRWIERERGKVKLITLASQIAGVHLITNCLEKSSHLTAFLPQYFTV